MNHDTRLESVAANAVLVDALALNAGTQTTIDYTVTAEPGWWTLHAGRVTTTWMYGVKLPGRTLCASEGVRLRVQYFNKRAVQVLPHHVCGARPGMM